MEGRGRLNSITLRMSHSLPGVDTHTKPHWPAGQGLESLTLGQHHPTLHSEGYLHNSTLGMLFGIPVCHFSSLPWTLEFVLDSGGCFLEVGMLTLALQSR